MHSRLPGKRNMYRGSDGTRARWSRRNESHARSVPLGRKSPLVPLQSGAISAQCFPRDNHSLPEPSSQNYPSMVLVPF